MQVKQSFILLLLFLSNLTACSQGNNTNTLFERPGYKFPYDLAEPDKSWKLADALYEISGLSYIDSQRLACVQDENGIIYIFNLISGKIEREIDFGDNGDYEGIEIIENDAWVLKSNGTLFKVKDYLQTTLPNVKKHPTVLTDKNNAEGLAYDPVNKNLLIACKGDPFMDDRKGSGYKAIYSFDLETKLIDTEPFLLIPEKIIKYYNSDATFKPSGIAIHPVTGNVYILGSVGKLLLVFSRMGEMLAVIHLNPKIFTQPEGICFSPDGTLYISNEGAGQEGTILRFDPGD
jgi:uncharacterized protein YjiK